MCDFSGRLIAWMDCELEANEAAVLGRHVRGCAECRERVAAYEDVSRGFAAYCNVMLETAMVTKIHRKLPRWVTRRGRRCRGGCRCAGAGVTAALSPTGSGYSASGKARTPIAPKTGTNAPNPVQRRHTAAHRKTQTATWAVAEPAIQIAIPGDECSLPARFRRGLTSSQT